ncbi:HisA/HisF-related TIM barrel protein [Zavarzinella formosa]|uniref:HisA/HisF-related TIM barrel protein n=1 Tax=Zavarzinella formosa TaxID=360055 RepID=UPI0002D477B1|nr:HisA/HisF-related TIM barrel protein [Zavarzinella formosa]
MRIIPVLDLLNGVVVRGVGGRRHEYRPIQSVLTSSVDPIPVANALIEAFNPSEIYIADLDAIQSSGSCPLVPLSPCHPVTIWLDAGVRDAASAMRVAGTGCHVVAGLETVESPEVLREILEAVSPEKVVFSLDLKAGTPLRTWPGIAEPLAIARHVVSLGVQRMIVLDLARVGEGQGTGTDDLCRRLAGEFPGLDLIAGGGITSIEDIQQLADLGVKGALVASALHDGRIRPTNT